MRYIIIVIITATLLIATSACSQNTPPPDPTSIAIATKVAQAPDPTVPPSAPPPTKPQRIANIIPLATQAARNKGLSPTPDTPQTNVTTSAPLPEASTFTPGSQPTGQTSIPNPPPTGKSLSIPQNPQFNDEVLLQHLYQNLDLDRFALPEDHQIPKLETTPERWRPSLDTYNKFPLHEVAQHPYLHVFPGLEQSVKNHLTTLQHITQKLSGRKFEGTDEDTVLYHYRGTKGRLKGNHDVIFNPPHGISHFIHYPWFEPFWLDIHRDSERNRIVAKNYDHMGHNFGDNSTRGVLADAVTNLFKEAIKPGIRPYAVYHPWDVPTEHHTSDLGSYLRTPVNIGHRYSFDKTPQTHVMPVTKWELLHPKLPIVQVTSYGRTVLPLTQEHPPISQMTPEQIIERFNRVPRVRQILAPYDYFAKFWLREMAKHRRILERDPTFFDKVTFPPEAAMYDEFALAYQKHDKDIVRTLAHIPDNVRREIFNTDSIVPDALPNPTPHQMEDLLSRPHSTTIYAVSFVVSFQNRWESFTDPNRWLIRFQDDLLPENHKAFRGSAPAWNSEPYVFNPRTGSINREIHDQYPYYWHTTDYMQHKLIGPVVLNIYESDVLEPGVYSFMPRINHWPAPGPIIKDDRQLFTGATIWRQNFDQQNRPVVTRPFRITKEALDRIIDTFLKNPETLGTTDSKGRTRTYGRLSRWYHPYSPNPGYPLPGHVLTTPKTAPGTEMWKRYNLDDRKW